MNGTVNFHSYLLTGIHFDPVCEHTAAAAKHEYACFRESS